MEAGSGGKGIESEAAGEAGESGLPWAGDVHANRLH